MRRTPRRKQDSRKAAALYQVRLPVFISDAAVGLGDVIKKATAAVGITACAACDRRAAMLNRWVTFTRRTRR
jgi:hypothetical protein